ncbi:hypothetical protein ZIOFF_051473 [Zingiber officinale]|uniref:Prp19 coiled-coil region domain-containing protein n=1 Tax=Zingiber officinale TaxID=94328 RepID=A0A8J5KUM8_ZINOF|nr:hypothetical protein ZIOFF_051473 [Zingiber officinale]
MQGKAGLLGQPNNQLVVAHRSDSFVEDLEAGVLVRGLHEGCEEDVAEVPELPRPLGAPDAQVAKPGPLQAASIPGLLGMLQNMSNVLILKEFNVVFLLLKQEWDALMLSNFALENQLHTARQKLSHLCIRLITAKDHASVQINIGHLDDNGVYTGQYTTFALSGFIRAQNKFEYEKTNLVMAEVERLAMRAIREERSKMRRHWKQLGGLGTKDSPKRKSYKGEISEKNTNNWFNRPLEGAHGLKTLVQHYHTALPPKRLPPKSYRLPSPATEFGVKDFSADNFGLARKTAAVLPTHFTYQLYGYPAPVPNNDQGGNW